MSQLRCSICRSLLDPPRRDAHRHFPFCSKRCQQVDLSRWLGGSYRVSEPLSDESGDEPEADEREPSASS